MKYVILIHSNPQPWGHPTGDYLDAYQALPREQREQMDSDFERLLTQLQADGELVTGEALGDPSTARLYRWDDDGTPLATDGPYSEVKEHLAGFFLIDVASRPRGRVAAGDASRPRGLGPPLRRLRRLRGRAPGGDDGRDHAVGTRRRARAPSRMADQGRISPDCRQPASRSVPRRA